MLNIEYYKEELLKNNVIDVTQLAVVNDKPVKCPSICCNDCDYSCDTCENSLRIWLFSEYQGPTLDWTQVKIDTPILVKDVETDEWVRRYFAKFENNIVYTFIDGATSWSTSSGDTESWNFAKLVQDIDEKINNVKTEIYVVYDLPSYPEDNSSYYYVVRASSGHEAIEIVKNKTGHVNWEYGYEIVDDVFGL